MYLVPLKVALLRCNTLLNHAFLYRQQLGAFGIMVLFLVKNLYISIDV